MYWIIGDIHGCVETLKKLINIIENKNYKIIFLGDIIDRGPSSRQTVEYIRDGVKNKGWVMVKGNHEQLMIDGIYEHIEGFDNNMYSGWIWNGGNKTEISYDNNINQMLEDVRWFETLPQYLTFEVPGYKDLLVSHAPSVDYLNTMMDYQNSLINDEELSELDIENYKFEIDSYSERMLWNRIIPCSGNENYFGISGHNVWNTHKEAEDGYILNSEIGFASIDTGCCFPTEQYGILTAISYPSLEVVQVKNIDMEWKID